MSRQINKKLNRVLIILISISFILNLYSCNTNKEIITQVEEESTKEDTLVFNSPSLQEELNLKVEDKDEEATKDEEEVMVNYLSMPLIHGKEDMYFLEMEKSFLPGQILYRDYYKEYILELLKQTALKFCNSKKESDLILFIAPNKSSCYKDMLGSENYDLENEGLPSKISDFLDYIKANSNIKIVYPINEVTKARKDGNVYYRLDSHWTDFGAHVGAASLIKAVGGEVQNYQENGVFQTPIAFPDGDCIPYPRPEGFNIEDKICGILDLTNKAVDNGFVFRKYETQIYGEKVVDGYSLDPKDDRRLIMMDDSMGYGMIRTIFPYFRDVTFLQYNSVPNADPKYLTGADIFVVEIVERNIIQLMNNLVTLLNKDIERTDPENDLGLANIIGPASELGPASKLGPSDAASPLGDSEKLKQNIINTIE